MMKPSSTAARWWEMGAARGRAPRRGKAESSLPSARFSSRGSGGRRRAARSLRRPQKVGGNAVYSQSLSSPALSSSPFHQHFPLFSCPPSPTPPPHTPVFSLCNNTIDHKAKHPADREVADFSNCIQTTGWREKRKSHKFCLSLTELERKMSTRRTRQELIEQGVLKELPDNNGKSLSVSVPAPRCLSLTARGPRALPPTCSRANPSATLRQQGCTPPPSCRSLRPALTQQPHFHFSASEMRFCFLKRRPSLQSCGEMEQIVPCGGNVASRGVCVCV